MKKIKYSIHQGTAMDGSDILFAVEMGYSEANLAIAQKEAYNGEYTIEEGEDEPAALSVEERLELLETLLTAPDYTAGTWYYRGSRVTFDGSVYICVAPEGTACVLSPAEYPVFWQKNS